MAIDMISGQRPKFWKNPFGFFGVPQARASLLCAMFDSALGVGTFVLNFFIWMKGDLGENHVYPSKGFNMPRELVITFVVLGYYNAATGLGLYFATGYRMQNCLWIWMVLNIPMCLAFPPKVYEILAVRNFALELQDGHITEDEAFDTNWIGWNAPGIVEIIKSEEGEENGEGDKHKKN